MSPEILEIFELLVRLAIIVVTTFGTVWVKKRIDNEALQKADYWTKKAVEAAEIYYEAKGQGVPKKEFVTKFLKERVGVPLTEDELSILIDAVVEEFNNNTVWNRSGGD